jgi:exodeoxyribonuclease-3
VRLLTYNIRRGGGSRLAEIASIIRGCAPDIVLLQEATDPDNVQRLADLAGMPAAGAHHGQSLGYLSRAPVAHVSWQRPRFSKHAFIELVPEGDRVRLFGVHLSAVHAAWTERRRVFELRALLKAVRAHGEGFHILAGDFNTLAPGELLERSRLPWRLRPFIWMSGGQIRWRTIRTVLEAGYIDAFRLHHPAEPGHTMPAWNPHVRLDYVFVPEAYAGAITRCDIVHGPAAASASDHLAVVADVAVA